MCATAVCLVRAMGVRGGSPETAEAINGLEMRGAPQGSPALFLSPFFPVILPSLTVPVITWCDDMQMRSASFARNGNIHVAVTTTSGDDQGVPIEWIPKGCNKIGNLCTILPIFASHRSAVHRLSGRGSYMIKTEINESYLILGWQVTHALDPRYWLTDDARPGSQHESDLIKIPAGTMASHSAIIAQSGSGKSFFLGRLIEEIMLRTKARCIILDPNADFRNIAEIEDAALWKEARYDMHKRRGKLPHEASREEFEAKWSRLPIRIRMGKSIYRRKGYKSLELWWPSLSVEFLGEELDPMLRGDLYHCHAFVQALGIFLEIKVALKREQINLFDEAQRLFTLSRSLQKEAFLSEINKEFYIQELNKKISDSRNNTHFLVNFEQSVDVMLTSPKYVSEDVERFYFGKVREFEAMGILRKEAIPISFISPRETQKPFRERGGRPLENRLEVIDLPSLPDKNTRLLAINTLLARVWEEARIQWDRAMGSPANTDKRVPTFIVVDEAHNLVPAEPRGKAEIALREQFRTIVAEGRKYGLFLILVSQRPDKLDPLILSECENKAVMRLGSKSILDMTRQMLGLDDLPSRLLEKCLEFGVSRALLIGRWVSEEPQIIYCAARRTVEGGRNLHEQHWANPWDFDPQIPQAIGFARRTEKSEE